MKLMPTLVFSLFAMNALALPVLREPEAGMMVKVFKDHLDSDQLYYRPDVAPLYELDQKKPLFSMVKTKDEEGEKVHLEAGFKPQVSKVLQKRINFESDTGKTVSMLFSDRSYLMNSQKKLINGYGWSTCTENIDSPITFKTDLSEDKASELVSKIKSARDKVALMQYCHLVNGVTPEMDAKVTMNEYQILKALSPDREYFFHENEVKDVISNLIKEKKVSVEIMGGDAGLGDYAYAITKKILSRYAEFDENGDGYFIYENKAQDQVSTEYFEGRDFITKPLCVDLDIAPIKNFPELMSF